MIEKYTKYTSLISIMLFIGAVWFEFLYYQSFDIDIFSFISFSEIISLFISKIPFLLFIGLLALFFVFMSSEIFKGFFDKLKINPRYNWKQRSRISNKGLIYTGYSFVAYFALVFGPIFFSKNHFIRSEEYFILKVLGHIIFIYWILMLSLLTNTTISKNNLYQIAFLVTFFVSIYFMVTYSMWSVKYAPKNHTQISITMKDSTRLSTSDTLIYVGKTNGYIFLYNTNPKQNNPFTLTLKTDDVKTMNIYKQIHWLRIP